ncbi:OmpA family protein [Marinibacterium sp. SX1]|uniref:OmpA/MotB family protein n=1 Tax=Marinibacterium sp. SX1 TaxID=3388424 RepID=UPI003D167582
MRAQAKQVRHEEEEESAFVSMTDMTVGFLFIMMILLAFFASQMRDPDAVSKAEHDAVAAQRDTFERQRDEWQALALARADRIIGLEALLERLRRERAELLAERDRLILSMDTAGKRIETLETRLAELLAELEQKDARISELTRQLAELQQVDPLEAYLAQVSQVRRQVLTRLRDAIRTDFPDLQVELSEESDALRFQGEGLFASGSPNLSRDKREIVSRLARRLDEVLPCFTLGSGSHFDDGCNPGFVMIEAVQIEGHTDDVGSDRLNRNLSANRANSTFFAMTEAADGIMQHLNLKLQPVLSVAAYGPDRPVTTNETPEGRATNRRIDLRFIMVTPQDTDGIDVIRAALESMDSQP